MEGGGLVGGHDLMSVALLAVLAQLITGPLQARSLEATVYTRTIVQYFTTSWSTS